MVMLKAINIVTLEELSSGRCIEKQVPHREIRPYRGRYGGSFGLIASSGSNLYGCFILGPSRLQDDFGNCRYTGKGFSSKPIRQNVRQVLRLRNFGCGMPLKAQHGIRRTHAHAIINDLDKSTSGIFDNHAYLCRTGVHSILHELFNYGRRSLHHLPRRNHVGKLRRQYFKFAHS